MARKSIKDIAMRCTLSPCEYRRLALAEQALRLSHLDAQRLAGRDAHSWAYRTVADLYKTALARYRRMS